MENERNLANEMCPFEYCQILHKARKALTKKLSVGFKTKHGVKRTLMCEAVTETEGAVLAKEKRGLLHLMVDFRYSIPEKEVSLDVLWAIPPFWLHCLTWNN